MNAMCVRWSAARCRTVRAGAARGAASAAAADDARRARRAYRRLLRRAHALEAVNGNAAWRNEVRAQFRAASAADAVQRAEAVATVLESTALHTELMVKYNIGAAIDERERIRRTAARVGLGIREWDDPASDVLDKYQNALAAEQTQSGGGGGDAASDSAPREAAPLPKK